MMTTTRLLYILIIAIACNINISAQQLPDIPPHHQQVERPTVLDLVNEVRNSIGLDHKEFDKTYSAYEKYLNTVFGDSKQSSDRPPMSHGNHPGGRRGRMGGGGPGGMPPHGGEFGERGRNFDEQKPPRQKPADIEKLEKTKTKAEEKLCKNMKKLFKKNPEKYDLWLSTWKNQNDRLFPHPPTRQDNIGD